ncbi:MAG: hypothetical protein JSS09_09385 [Verrucomicrobia bacterium]|nr:hypothetical protein [Verrucomicrobiota bacterium]
MSLQTTFVSNNRDFIQRTLECSLPNMMNNPKIDTEIIESIDPSPDNKNTFTLCIYYKGLPLFKTITLPEKEPRFDSSSLTNRTFILESEVSSLEQEFCNRFSLPPFPEWKNIPNFIEKR